MKYGEFRYFNVHRNCFTLSQATYNFLEMNPLKSSFVLILIFHFMDGIVAWFSSKPEISTSIASNTRTPFYFRHSTRLDATKSGGLPIKTHEQFQVEVLHEIVQEAKDKEVTKYEPNFKPILVFYTAPWCGPCRLATPVVKDIMKDYSKIIDVMEVCTDDMPEVAEESGVVSIPTIQIYHRGILMDTIVGCVAKNVLASAINKILDDLGLDTENMKKIQKQ